MKKYLLVLLCVFSTCFQFAVCANPEVWLSILANNPILQALLSQAMSQAQTTAISMTSDQLGLTTSQQSYLIAAANAQLGVGLNGTYGGYTYIAGVATTSTPGSIIPIPNGGVISIGVSW